jgi:zinc transport system substrate-binding protein
MNKMHKGLFVGLLLSVITVVAFGSTLFIYQKNSSRPRQEGLVVVTSFYPMYIAAANITEGVEGLLLENLSEPETGCLHDYQMTPEDMRLLSTADVFIVNGGGIETFLGDVAKEYPELMVVEASEGLEMSEENAHVWMSVENHSKQVENITAALCRLDEKNAAAYEKNARAYMQQLSGLTEQEAALRQKTSGQKVALFHEAYAYLAQELDMQVVYVMDLDEERQISAGEVTEVLDAVEEEQIALILAEEDYGRDMGDVVEAQCDVRVLYLDTLVRGQYEKDSYIRHMTENLQMIETAVERDAL